MSLFPRFATGDFTPLFRLLDEYDTHRGTPRIAESVRTFQPRFDVCENDKAYELHGELPGINQSDINIEFSDPQTIVISGRSERAFESGTPVGAIEGGQEKGRITEKGHENGQEAEQDKTERKTQHGSKYWVSERSIGEYHRSFSFPARVDQDAVKASLKNGILSVVVPKAAPAPLKKISIAEE